MKVITEIADFPSSLPYPTVTLGNFDGLHRGHQHVLELLCQQAKQSAGTSIVVTFRPHPIKILHPERAPSLLCTYDEKLELLGQTDVDWVLEIPFDRDFSEWSASRFIEELLIRRIGVHYMLAGPDCHFGKNREGDATMLVNYGTQHGFDVGHVGALNQGGDVVSSSQIRRLVNNEGNVRRAADLLGRAFRFTGDVVKGDQRGRKLGFPTANLRPVTELVPCHGVYAAHALRGDGSSINAVVNVGVRPTFGVPGVTIEAHLLDFSGDLYGEHLSLDFVDRIRNEQKFDGIESLVAQIGADVATARSILA